MLVPVILSGGSGTRLWPLSRRLFPKQLMPILGGQETLIQATVARLAGKPDIAGPLVVTGEPYRFMVASQLQETGVTPSAIILEPFGRNTAPAVTLAALTALRDHDDPELLVLPADHFIRDPQAFLDTVETGRALSGQGLLVTFGIVPDHPETGYGYIRRQPEPFAAVPAAYPVAEFVEKPDLDTARGYLADGNHLWNSGMFLFRADAVLRELEALAPDIVAACRKALAGGWPDLEFLRLSPEDFAPCRSESFDYAVMEKTDKAAVVPLECGWSDIGSWSALHEVREKDANGNVCVGDVLADDCTGSYLHATSRLVAGLGLENMVIVETKDAVFAAPRDRVQDVKRVVDTLKQNGRQEAQTHCKVFRPWGHYEGVDHGLRYQVKRIVVYPGQTLSLQKHYHRAEHWVVVRGTALVTRGQEEVLLTEDQSMYIPLGTVHRLHNPGKVNLELIEIQTGSYLDEDDIVRFDDVYGRHDAGADAPSPAAESQKGPTRG
ncbi:MAG: mannose-1-phosphate guanylyltransferase/mannose-6-phosphate isomerase [Desulfovibrionaceae bacterium]